MGSWRTSGHEGGREVRLEGQREDEVKPTPPPKDPLRFQCRWTLTSINLIQSEKETQVLNHYRWKRELPSGTMSAFKIVMNDYRSGSRQGSICCRNSIFTHSFPEGFRLKRREYNATTCVLFCVGAGLSLNKTFKL